MNPTPQATTPRGRANQGKTAVLIVVILVVVALGGALVYTAQQGGFGGLFPGPSHALPFDQQIVRIGLESGWPLSLDPALTAPSPGDQASEYQVEQLIFPALVTWGANLNVIPWATQRLPTITGGGRVYTFHIRPHLQWSDGAPINAQTFAYSLNRALQPCVEGNLARHYNIFLYAIKGATELNPLYEPNCGKPPPAHTLIGSSLRVVDPLTLRITLAQPDAAFLAELTIPAALGVPQQLISQYGDQWTNHLAGFGGNLFLLKQQHDASLQLVRSPYNFNGKTRIKEIDFTSYPYTLSYPGSFVEDLPGVDDSWLAYSDGSLDVAQLASPTWHTVEDRADVRATPTLALDYLQPNWTEPPFDNPLARQAFALALDKSALSNDATVTSAAGPIIATNHTIPLGNPGYNPRLVGVDGSQRLSGNLTLARQDLARYVSEACGGQVKACPHVTLTYINAFTQATALAIFAQWQAAFPGYPMSVGPYPFWAVASSISPVWQTAQQLDLLTYFYDYADPSDWTSFQFLPSAFNYFSNAGVVNDPTANALMSKADGDQNPTDRIRLYRQAEQRLVTDCAWIPLDQRESIYLVSPHLHGYQLTANGFPTYTGWLSMYLAT